MPQLAKGGKWVFGWAVVGLGGKVQIPLVAYTEYGFQDGETVIFIRGSRTSGGFGIGRAQKLAQAKIPLQTRIIGNGMITETRQVMLPSTTSVKAGDRLLVVRGSGLALGFLQRGPIYEEALKHPEIEVFTPCERTVSYER